ncbi:MAG: 50S ribosomal protein L5 [candidate division Zixibacteria bacterium RBG_16_53_22]|nr:MAG: 50S ribosomal protein L5 [candidate division Zixibacteria bacterium RBG_16_53_22]
MARLKGQYKDTIRPSLKGSLGLGNINEVPRIEKIVVNIGVGEAIADAKKLDAAMADMTAITGQKPVVRRARKSISNFKLRAGMPVGCTVTLRGDRMYEFLDRLINIAIPRIRDFRGIPANSFDGRGNYTLGITEQIIFPEIDYDKIDRIRGMNITIVTTAKTDEQAFELLQAFGMPFKRA